MTPGNCCPIELANISIATYVKGTFLGALSLFLVAALMTRFDEARWAGSRE